MITKRTTPRVMGRRGLRLSFWLVVVLSLSSLVQIAQADGGVILCQQTVAPFSITIFFTEMPLRPGPVDLSVLLEKTEGHAPILDADVFIELEHEGGAIVRAEATRRQARNKLLYCSLINLPAAGRWKLKVHVTNGEHRAVMLSELVVLAPQPVLLSYWKLTAAPPVIMLLFTFNQWLRRRRSDQCSRKGELYR